MRTEDVTATDKAILIFQQHNAEIVLPNIERCFMEMNPGLGQTVGYFPTVEKLLTAITKAKENCQVEQVVVIPGLISKAGGGYMEVQDLIKEIVALNPLARIIVYTNSDLAPIAKTVVLRKDTDPMVIQANAKDWPGLQGNIDIAMHIPLIQQIQQAVLTTARMHS